MREPTRRTELREFLRARRRALAPETVGLPRGRRRRVPGLRREELAALAGVGVTWYTWLEQGRDIRVAMDTLERVAQALRLSPSDTVYLYALARPAEQAPGADAAPAGELSAPVRAVLDAFAGPALVMSPATDVLACNALADALYRFDDFAGPFRRNLLARTVLDPARRIFYRDYDIGVRNLVALFRINLARRARDPYMEALLDYLRASSAEFVAVWNEQETALPMPVSLRIRSDALGDVNFHSVRFATPDLPEHLVALLAPADAATREVVSGWTQARGMAGRPASPASRSFGS